MIRRPPRSTRTDTLFPYPTLFRSPEQCLVAHDELDLPAGVARLKFDGGHGGQNGLRDIIAHLGHGGFHRLRIGIGHPGHKDRSEEHTSELQSLMRISYAVFCLKKTK